MRVVGTAGHVDHGKSTLVQAISGTHPDRLKEERQREMTIDLGFAYTTLPDGEDIAFVDVPGHRDFIENMLAGIGGIDACLFAIAADEGVMPQTREHLAILDLLQIPSGVIALTKIDMVDDPEWLDLIHEEIRAAVNGTVMQDAPIVPVSAREGSGVADVVEALQVCLAGHAPRHDSGKPRLSVDRVFTIAGFGTVVTGTLLDGFFSVGDEVVLLPDERRARIRGLQSHMHKITRAQSGSRVAVNLSGIAVDAIQRGDLVTYPGMDHATRRLDVHFRLLPDFDAPLTHNMEVKLFLGASETVARVRLLGTEQILPADEGFLQLETARPVTARRGDRYILRRPSPGATLGGGQVLDVHPARRYKRFDNDALDRLRALLAGTPEDLFLQALNDIGIGLLNTVWQQAGLPESAARPLTADAEKKGRLIRLKNENQSQEWVVSRSEAEILNQATLHNLEEYHQTFPLRPGIPREELKNRLRLKSPVFDSWLADCAARGVLAENGPWVALTTHTIQFTAQQNQQIERLRTQFAAQPAAPPTIKECHEQVGEEVFSALLALGEFVLVAPEVAYLQTDYQRMRQEVIDILRADGTITVADLRDRWQTSRRYVLPFLEHLDAEGVTLRDGNQRRLNPRYS